MTSESQAPLRLDAPGEAAEHAAADGTRTTAAITPRLLLEVIVPAIVLLNVLNAIAVVLYHEGHKGRFFRTFSLDGEANVPAWFSSALLLSAAALLALVAVDAFLRRERWARHWTGLSLVYVLLSLDETAEIHERIGSWLRAHLDLHGPLHYAGVIPALALAAFVGIAFLRFLRALPRVTRVGIVVAAALYVFGAAGVEAMSGWWAESHQGSTALLLVSTVEENLEMAGTTIFILVVLHYLARFGRPVSLRAEW